MYYDTYKDFFEKFKTKVDLNEMRGIITGFIRWKQNVFAAQWKKEFYKDQKCPNCGNSNLIHHEVDWEGRMDGWSICPSIWETDCPDCKSRFICVSNDDGELLDHWTTDID